MSTPLLTIRGLQAYYGTTHALKDIDLDIEAGGMFAILGPSGSGKSTLLRAVAGLEPLTAGTVSWDGEDLAGVKVHKRGFGLVFQDGQLFPTMTVERNIAYGLSALPKAARRQRVAELLDLVGLAGYGSRRPTELSGGQAQRVALARSLAPSPRALLLDEPLSALDTGLRRRLSDDLLRILRATGTTALYVTHDHQEAFTVADRVAVLDHGRLLQLDGPEALRHAPATREVAAFLGATAFLTQAQADYELAIRKVRGLQANDAALSSQITAREADERRAVAQLESARSDFERVKLDFKRREGLLRSGSVSQEEFTRIRSLYAMASAALSACSRCDCGSDMTFAPSTISRRGV